MRKFLLHLIFIVIVAGDLIGEYLQNSQLDLFFKPLIMIWIAGYFFLHSKCMDKKVILFAGLGFLFSWVGDWFMIFSSLNGFFIAGIASFLITQLLYAFLFLRTIHISGKKPFLKKKPAWLILYIAFGMIVYIILFVHLNMVLKIIVFVYVVAILSMSAMALNRYGNGHPISFVLVFTGSLFFVLSDLLIGINKFVVPVSYEGLWIMTTYVAAQYLIMLGILKQYE